VICEFAQVLNKLCYCIYTAISNIHIKAILVVVHVTPSHLRINFVRNEKLEVKGMYKFVEILEGWAYNIIIKENNWQHNCYIQADQIQHATIANNEAVF
jgi:hypothetical protein